MFSLKIYFFCRCFIFYIVILCFFFKHCFLKQLFMEQQDMPIYILLKVVLFSILPYRVRAWKVVEKKSFRIWHKVSKWRSAWHFWKSPISGVKINTAASINKSKSATFFRVHWKSIRMMMQINIPIYKIKSIYENLYCWHQQQETVTSYHKYMNWKSTRKIGCRHLRCS